MTILSLADGRIQSFGGKRSFAHVRFQSLEATVLQLPAQPVTAAAAVDQT
jgi:hypothetical protein